ncbi:MAG TPA: hypothetical protein VIY48_13110, partial [Candidatus Paceibacterota bacterium]
IAAYVASSTQVNPTVASFIGGNVGIGTTSPFARLSVVGNAFITGNATTTNLAITNITSSLLKTDASGNVIPAVLGTDYQNFGYLFPSNATSTLIGFNGGLTAYASSTIGNGLAGLTISGNSTTTGNALIGGNLSVTRTSNPTQGQIFFGNSSNTYISYDGSNFSVSGGALFTAGNPIIAQATNSTLGLGARYAGNQGTVYFGGTNSATPDAVISNNAGTELARFTNGGSFGVGTTSPASTLSVQGNGLFSGNVSLANLIATGTLIVGGNTTLANATTTNLAITNIANAILSTNANGSVVATTSIGANYLSGVLSVANGGTGSSTLSGILIGNGTNPVNTLTIGSGLSLSGTTLSNAIGYDFPLTGNATSTLTQFNAGLTAFASSTIGNGTQAGGLTINGSATTTGNAVFSKGGASGFQVGSTGAAGSIAFARSSDASLQGFVGYLTAAESSNFSIKSGGGAGYLTFYTSATEKARIDASGNLGLGTTSPYAQLSISNSATTAANTPLLAIASTTNGLSTSTLLTVLANGQVGIGMTAPAAAYILDTNGAIHTGSYVVSALGFYSVSSSAGVNNAAGNAALAFRTNNVDNRMVIDTSGNVGIGTTSPFATLTVSDNTVNANTTAFLISSSTQNSTTTRFSVANNGDTNINVTNQF